MKKDKKQYQQTEHWYKHDLCGGRGCNVCQGIGAIQKEPDKFKEYWPKELY